MGNTLRCWRFAVLAASLASLPLGAQSPLPVRIILVGDSTTAPVNGWGPGFCALATPQVTCDNRAKNGRSTSSYRAEGSWSEVMRALERNSEFRATYVLIQFGHNDQPGKPGRSTDLATEFPANLRQYVREVKSTGAKPVLLTPLTRRQFQDGKLNNNLVAWGDAARQVAAGEDVPSIDLNAISSAAVQKMGAVEANTLAQVPPPAEIVEAAQHGNSPPAPRPPADNPSAPVFDYTHLGEKGSAFFGRMVARELVKTIPELRAYFNLGTN